MAVMEQGATLNGELLAAGSLTALVQVAHSLFLAGALDLGDFVASTEGATYPVRPANLLQIGDCVRFALKLVCDVDYVHDCKTSPNILTYKVYCVKYIIPNIGLDKVKSQ